MPPSGSARGLEGFLGEAGATTVTVGTLADSPHDLADTTAACRACWSAGATPVEVA